MSEPGGREPFWDVVRRRHPDVDVVLLPPAEATAPPGSDRDPVSVETAQELAARLDQEFASVWELLLGGPPEPSPVRWTSSPVPGTARPVRSQRSRDERGEDLVGTSRAVLTDLGWTTSEPQAGLPLLVAERDDRDLRLTVHDGAVLLEVHGPAVPVRPRTLRALRAEARS
ncbi:hypothetical protein [Aeromicrobium erythreum]|jgi:hypothetical protein|uniref:Uncharacterized protein n=2 Tax=Aeromicrobium TaxID=2040 RepID=A0A0U4CQM2_9ACTN|nr:hypothetical protein [Aeromicrobium erythreum]ALX05382.1 hypothetical protein AERYTH_12090 [Aeromicrobium erythreum]